MLNDANWRRYVWAHALSYGIKKVCALTLSGSTVNTYKVNFVIFFVIEKKRRSGSSFHCTIICCYHFIIKTDYITIVVCFLSWEYFLQFNRSLELFYNILAFLIKLLISYFLTILYFGLDILSVSPSRQLIEHHFLLLTLWNWWVAMHINSIVFL